MVIDGAPQPQPDSVGQESERSTSGVTLIYRENNFYRAAMPAVKGLLESAGIEDVRIMAFPEGSEPLSAQSFENPWDFNKAIKGTKLVYDRTSSAFIKMLQGKHFKLIWDRAEAEDTGIVIDDLFQEAVSKVLEDKDSEVNSDEQAESGKPVPQDEATFKRLFKTALSISTPEKIVIDLRNIKDHWPRREGSEDVSPEVELKSWLEDLGYPVDQIEMTGDAGYYSEHEDEIRGGNIWVLVDRHADSKVPGYAKKVNIPAENTISSMTDGGLLKTEDIGPEAVQQKFAGLLAERLGVGKTE